MKSSITYQLESLTSIFGFSLTEKYIVSAAQTCIVHSLQCQKCQLDKGQVCSNHHAMFDIGKIWDAQIQPTSNLMLTAGHNLKMGLWDLENGTHIRDFVGHTGCVKRVLFLDKDSTFVSGFDDGMILLWSRAVEEPTRNLRGHTGSITRITSHDNLLFSGSSDNTIRIWNIATGDCIRILEHSAHVSGFSFSPNFSLFRVACGNGEVRIWNWREGELIAVCQADTRASSQFSDIDGNLVTCGVDGAIRTWTQEGSLIKTFAALKEPSRALVKIGRFVVTGGKGGRLRVWDWENEEWLFDLQDLHDPAFTVVGNFMAAYGKLAVSLWEKNGLNQIQVWELAAIEEAAMEYICREKPL